MEVTSGVWPQGLLDAYIAMIPKVNSDSTPLGQRPLCVLPVVKRLWASLWLTHLKDWVQGCIPESVISLGNGVSSVEAWFSTALERRARESWRVVTHETNSTEVKTSGTIEKAERDAYRS